MERETRTVAERVVQAVATTTDTDPLELPTLYDAVDPDALASLVEGMSDGEVVFAYAGCEVTVTYDGGICAERNGTDYRCAGSASLSD